MTDPILAARKKAIRQLERSGGKYMVAIHKFQLPIGDWSGDGHRQCDWFTIQSNKPVEEVREAHYKAVKLPLNIEEFQDDYEPPPVSKKEIQAIRDCGLNPDDYLDYYLPEKIRVKSPMAMAQLWIDLIMKADPSIELKLLPEPNMLPLYGSDSQGRSIGFVGYGLFE